MPLFWKNRKGSIAVFLPTIFVDNLQDLPIAVGKIYIKVKYKRECGKYHVLRTVAQDSLSKNYHVQFNERLELQKVKLLIDEKTRELLPFYVVVKVKQSHDDKKLGYVKVNLAEFCGEKTPQTRRYLLRNTNFNAILCLRGQMQLVSGDPLFRMKKSAQLGIWDESQDVKVYPKSPFHSRFSSENSTNTEESNESMDKLERSPDDAAIIENVLDEILGEYSKNNESNDQIREKVT